jgi:hypothetical protein
LCWRICVKNPFFVYLKTLNEMKKYAPKIIQNVLQNGYIFMLKIYHCNVLSPINKIIMNIHLIKEKKIVLFPLFTLLEIMSFATGHYAIGMQLVVICNYLGHVCNYKFDIVLFFSYTIVCATNVQLSVYNMDTCHKNDGLNLYILK